MRILLIALALLTPVVATAQGKLGLRCPDPKATEACHSFQEILGKDPSAVASDFICFLENQDIFFTLDFEMGSPKLWNSWDSSGNPKESAIAGGTAIAWVTDHGVENDALEPNFVASGSWKHTLGRDRFHAENKSDDNHKLTIDASLDNVRVDATYINQKNETVYYELTVEALTGRYVEKWRRDDGWSDRAYGRCLVGTQRKGTASGRQQTDKSKTNRIVP